MTIRLKKLNLTLAPDSGLKTARLKDIFLFSIPDHSVRCTLYQNTMNKTISFERFSAARDMYIFNVLMSRSIILSAANA